MHMPTYIILQPYRNRSFDSNTRKPNISLMIMNYILMKYIGFLVIHNKIFVLNTLIIVSINNTYK